MRIHTDGHRHDLLAKISPSTRFGLYLVRSEQSQNYYRLGASGVGGTNGGSSGLLSRLTAHSRPRPSKPANRTQDLQSWRSLWVCEFENTVGSSLTLTAEAAVAFHFLDNWPLYAAQGERLIARGERSMFQTPAPVEAVLEHAAPLDCILARLGQVLGRAL